MKELWKSMVPYFVTKKQHPTQQQKQKYMLLTYRSGIDKLLPSTYYDSDSGWGCMLRVGQMFVANLYYRQEGRPLKDIIPLFYDNHLDFFSIQRVTLVAHELFLSKKPYEWFSPCECGFLIKSMLDSFDARYRVSICNDNCIFLSDIKQDREKLVVLAMCRIGLDSPQKEYLDCVLELMKAKHFNSILGGTPKKAHLFMKHVEGYLGFLDPHNTQKVPPFDQLLQREKQYISYLEWIPQSYIDCSMAVAFVVPRAEIEEFWLGLEQTRQKMGESFFLYIERQRPEYNSDEMGIIELCDDQELDDDHQQQPQSSASEGQAQDPAEWKQK